MQTGLRHPLDMGSLLRYGRTEPSGLGEKKLVTGVG